MKYVLDCSVAFKFVVAEKDSEKANLLRDDFRAGIHELICPDIFSGELGHALTKAERKAQITVGAALRLWSKVMATPPRQIPSLAITYRAIEISSLTRVGVFDCLYVALAEQERCELVTADGRLVKTLQARFPFIVSLATLP